MMHWIEAVAASEIGTACRSDHRTGKVFNRTSTDAYVVVNGRYVRPALTHEVEGYLDWEPINPDAF